MNQIQNYIESVKMQFQKYRLLGEKTFQQLDDEDLFEFIHTESNSIAIIVNHMHGNMKSRWTDFLTTDGEKKSRNRDLEFEHIIKTREELITKWNQGWECLFNALESINENNFHTLIYIRNQKQTIIEALNRQMTHYAYHVGQIVFIGTIMKGKDWESLSIAKGKSEEYNFEKFSKGKH